MAIAKVTRNFQVTIPREIREEFDIVEGTHVRFETVDGRIVIIPQQLVDADQAWFWTKEWQKGEKAADNDKKTGQVVGPFREVEEIRKHFGDT